MVNVIIREVVSNVWTFSTSFTRLGLFRIGGRSIAIKLMSGDVWVLASTPLTAETKASIDHLGPVKFIVGPSSVHHLFLAEFHEAYPNARLLSVAEAVEKKRNENLNWHGCQCKSKGLEWSVDIASQTGVIQIESLPLASRMKLNPGNYFSGFKNKDVAFLHSPSKTLIVADLIFNLPATEQYSESWIGSGLPLFSRFARLNPYTAIHRRLGKVLSMDIPAMNRDVKTVAGWDFQRIIPCHGDVIEVDGNNAWRAVYGMYLK